MNPSNQAHENEKLRTALENLCDALYRMGLGSASDYPLPGEYDTARSILAGAHEPDCGYTVTGHDHNCSCAAGDNLDFSNRNALMGRGGPRRVDVPHFAYIVEMLRECTGSTAMEYPEYRNAAIKAADYLELLLSEVYRLETALDKEREESLAWRGNSERMTEAHGELSKELGEVRVEVAQLQGLLERADTMLANLRPHHRASALGDAINEALTVRDDEEGA